MRKNLCIVGCTLLAAGLLASPGFKPNAKPTASTPVSSVSQSTSKLAHPTILTASLAGDTQSQARTSADVSQVTRNWAGYLATGNSYTGVSGNWTVPSVSKGYDSLSADATWIGIGGSSSNDLIQVGTENIVQNGQIITSAFYESLPADSQNIPDINVGPGDTMRASITETSAGKWTVTISDLTNGESFSQPVYYNSSESSAEWIEEAPSDPNGIMTLDNFGTLSFANASMVADGQTVGLADSDANTVGMEDRTGKSLTDISILDGNSFSVTRAGADNNASPDQAYSGDSWDSGRYYRYTQPDSNSYPGYTGYRHF